MSSRFFGVAISVCLAAYVVTGNSTSKTWAQANNQPSNGGIVNPAAPTPADQPSNAAPGASQQGANGRAGTAEATDQPVAAPAVTTNRRPRVTPTPISSSRNQNTNRSRSAYSPRLARSAPIMGDSISPSLLFQDELGSGTRVLPQGGGATRSKIAENSSSLPLDRFIFNYNHFHNAINENLQESSNIDRFTVGFEKTFLDQMASIEVRFPFSVDNDFSIPGDFTRNGSDAGNLSVTLKGVLTSDSSSLIAAGLTIDTPTGGGTVLSVNDITDPLVLDISNDAVHLSPFLGFLCAPRNGQYHQGFLQVDVPTNANSIEFSDVSGVNTTELMEQTLLYVDYQFAQELYQGRRSRTNHGIRRILGLAEVHYTTTLEDSDIIFSGTTANPLFELTSAGNRLDVVNLTLGLHTEFNCGTQLRLGTVAPITDDDDRFFDFEFQAQLNILLR